MATSDSGLDAHESGGGAGAAKPAWEPATGKSIAGEQGIPSLWLIGPDGKVIAKGLRGAQIKQVGERARAAISQLLGCTAHVKLHVKVSKNWSREPRGIRDMGYE